MWQPPSWRTPSTQVTSTQHQSTRPVFSGKIQSHNTSFFLILDYLYLYLISTYIFLSSSETKKTNTFQSFNKIRFNALTSHTYYHATKRSPTWQPPNLELQATLDNNFIGLETSLEVELLLINKYSLSSTFSLCNNFLK